MGQRWRLIYYTVKEKTRERWAGKVTLFWGSPRLCSPCCCLLPWHTARFLTAWPAYCCVFADVTCRLFTFVLGPGCGLQPIGWNRKCRNWAWKTHTERERKRGGEERKNSVKLFVERRDLALHTDCTLYRLYLFSCNARHAVKWQQKVCSDHVLLSL